jgi:hypothetical protein
MSCVKAMNMLLPLPNKHLKHKWCNTRSNALVVSTLQNSIKENRSHLYRASVPVHRRHDLERSVYKLPIVPGHESVAAEMNSDTTMSVRLRDAIAANEFPPAFYSHPIVVQNKGLALPLSIYIDGVPYSRTDTTIGFWLQNIVTGVRHLMISFRKKLACKCGCRGWCSYDAMLRVIHWVVKSLCLVCFRIPGTTTKIGSPTLMMFVNP